MVPGSSTPPSPVRWALAVSTPTSTLAARPLPPRALLRCALTLPSRSLRHAADRLQLLPAPRGARLPSRARASPHAPRRITPPGTPSRATLPSLPAAPPRPRALVHTLPPPAYACRRPVPSPRQWERLMLNPARLYPTARLQIVRDLFFREWQARAHRSHPRPTGAAAAASAADVKSTSGMRRTPRPFPNAVRPAIPTRHHSRPRRAARAASAASCTRCTSPTSRRRRARRWPSGRRRSPTTRRSAIGRHASRSLCPRTLPPVASQDDRPSTAHRAASPSPFANTHHIAVTIPAGPATTRASASAALAHSHDAVTATSPTPPPLGCSLTLAVESQPQHTSAAQHTSTTQHETPPTLHSPATANPCAASPTPAVRLPTHAPTDARRRPSQRPDSASLHAMQILPPPDTPSATAANHATPPPPPPPIRTAAPPPVFLKGVPHTPQKRGRRLGRYIAPPEVICSGRDTYREGVHIGRRAI